MDAHDALEEVEEATESTLGRFKKFLDTHPEHKTYNAEELKAVVERFKAVVESLEEGDERDRLSLVVEEFEMLSGLLLK
jgi:hypothetical protein